MSYNNVIFPKSTVFLVTGGAGFIGSNLCEALLNKDCFVKCLDNLSTGCLKNIDTFINNPNFTLIKGDIRNYNTCLDACEGVDYVLHQAAWGSVPRSIEMPLLYEEINIKGTLNMLEAARMKKVKKFIYASSSSVYGNIDSLKKTEGYEGKLLSPYALTKKTNEEYARLYSEVYKLKTVGLRYFNVFGRRQNPEGPYAAVIPKFVHAISHNEKPIIYGDGNQSRDFTFIENVIEANLKACKFNLETYGKVYNVAFGQSTSLLELVNFIKKKYNSTIQPTFMPNRIGDIYTSTADLTNIIRDIKYSPDFDIYNGLDMYIKTLKEIGNLGE